MANAGAQKRFLGTTRGQIVALLRRGAKTVDELRQALGLTDNAIRSHLSSLERDEMIMQQGVRRGPGAGKPAAVYEINPDAELMLSRAYAPLLGALVDELAATRSHEDAVTLMQAAGRRLAATMPGNSGDPIEVRVAAAAAVLKALGGDAQVEHSEGRSIIRGCGCPLSAVTRGRPEVCQAVQALVAEIVGAPVAECCDRMDRPQCRFEVSTAA
jgi:Predicted transcriptional regulator